MANSSGKKFMNIIPFNDEKLKLEAITERTLKFHFSKNDNFNHRSFVVENELKPLAIEIKKNGPVYILETKFLRVEVENSVKIYDKQNKLIHSDFEGKGYLKTGDSIYCYKKMLDIKGFYGFGVRRGRLNKKGEFLINWNTDDPNHFFDTDPLYQCHPFFIASSEDYFYGMFFDNTYRSYFDLGKENRDYYSFTAEGGELVYYFIYGSSPKEVINEYSIIVGRINLPPLWALGFHQSRWSYKSEKEVLTVASEFRKRNIPCDVIYLDIDYMDKFKVFTIDNKKFKNFKKMNESLAKDGFKIVTIIDPGVKKEDGYYVYEEGKKNDFFCKLNGEPATGYVWPGECVFPDFTDEKARKWWGERQKFLLENGVNGIWNDMNEPAILTKNDYSMMRFAFYFLKLRYPPVLSKTDLLAEKIKKIVMKTLPENVKHKERSHAEVHNVYGYLMCKASFEGMLKYEPSKRPFILTRSGFSGIQKYSAVWGGDNQSTWQHMFMSIITMQNLSLSGVPFVGEDIGGFWKSLNSKELFVRWMALGIFYPFFRDHSAMNTRRQEPWTFGKKYERIISEFIKLRYSLIPYIYSLFYEAKETGIPPMRSLFLEFPTDKKAYEVEDEFMFGPFLLVVPVYKPNEKKKVLYLPEGEWYNFYDYKLHKGGKYIEEDAPIDKVLLFARAGALVPMQKPQNFVGESKNDTLYIKAFPGKGEFLYYEDDGISFDYEKGIYNLIKLSIDEEKVYFEQIKKGFEGGMKNLVFKLKDKEIKFSIT
ncbi:MAG: TIM-barrel domain-containing protein [Brevinematia bacterium]